MIRLPFILVFAAFLFSVGVYGVLVRRNAVMVLMALCPGGIVGLLIFVAAVR